MSKRYTKRRKKVNGLRFRTKKQKIEFLKARKLEIEDKISQLQSQLVAVNVLLRKEKEVGQQGMYFRKNRAQQIINGTFIEKKGENQK